MGFNTKSWSNDLDNLGYPHDLGNLHMMQALWKSHLSCFYRKLWNTIYYLRVILSMNGRACWFMFSPKLVRLVSTINPSEMLDIKQTCDSDLGHHLIENRHWLN